MPEDVAPEGALAATVRKYEGAPRLQVQWRGTNSPSGELAGGRRIPGLECHPGPRSQIVVRPPGRAGIDFGSVARKAPPLPCIVHGPLRGSTLLVSTRNSHRGEMLAILKQDVGKIRQPTNLCQSKKEVEIFGPLTLDTVTAHGDQDVAADHDGGMHDRPAASLAQEASIDLFVTLELHDPRTNGIAIWVDHDCVCSQCDDIGMAGEIGHLTFEPKRQRQIIRIHSSNQLAARPLEAIVQRTNDPSIVEREDVHTVVALCDALGYLARAIFGAVVQDQKLEVRKRLLQNTSDGRFEEAFAVIDGEENADERSRHSYSRARRVNVVGHQSNESPRGGTRPSPQISRSTTSNVSADSTMWESWAMSPNQSEIE